MGLALRLRTDPKMTLYGRTMLKIKINSEWVESTDNDCVMTANLMNNKL
jgi:hypothetical protein